MWNFDNMTVAITGAANGIGKGCAEAFAREGAQVILLDLNEEKAKAVADEIAAKGGKALYRALDVTDEDNVRAVFQWIKEEVGVLDALVNSAGIITYEKFDEHHRDLWDKVINVDLRGTYFCMRFAAMMMRDQKKGAIINISAGAAKTGGLNPSPAYIAAKGGVNSLTFHFANQLAEYGVRVNAICPGPVDTDMVRGMAVLDGDNGNGMESIVSMTPLGLGLTEDIAQGAMYLAHPISGRFITGEILDINGGLIKD